MSSPFVIHINGPETQHAWGKENCIRNFCQETSSEETVLETEARQDKLKDAVNLRKAEFI